MQRSLEVGDRLEAYVFRTDQLREGQYIVRDITTGGDTTVLRDEKTLRPVWARGRGARRRWLHRFIHDTSTHRESDGLSVDLPAGLPACEKAARTVMGLPLSRGQLATA